MDQLNEALRLMKQAQELISTALCHNNQQYVVRYGIGRDLGNVIERTEKLRGLVHSTTPPLIIPNTTASTTTTTGATTPCSK